MQCRYMAVPICFFVFLFVFFVLFFIIFLRGGWAGGLFVCLFKRLSVHAIKW